MTKLSKRLQEISNLTEISDTFVDIGCDHGLLDIALANKYKNAKIIASDINENALNSAKKNIKASKLENRIITIKSNGLENIQLTKPSTVIISGMGAHTIVGILHNGYQKIKNIQTLIIQSNNDIDFLRKKITKLGFFIEKERLVLDSKIIYTIIIFKKGCHFYTRKQLYLGPFLIRENSILFQKKCQQELIKINSFYAKIPKHHWKYKYQTWWKRKVLKQILSSRP